MADSRPVMLLLMDENVPSSVAEFFANRGHDVRYVRDLFPAGVADPVIATLGDKHSAIIVSWDRDFDRIASRVPEGNRARFRRLGRITFSCNEARGVEFAERWIESIEFHYDQASRRSDHRLIIQVLTNGLKVW